MRTLQGEVRTLHVFKLLRSGIYRLVFLDVCIIEHSNIKLFMRDVKRYGNIRVNEIYFGKGLISFYLNRSLYRFEGFEIIER